MECGGGVTGGRTGDRVSKTPYSAIVISGGATSVAARPVTFCVRIPAGRAAKLVAQPNGHQSHAMFNSAATLKWAGATDEIPHSHRIHTRTNSFRCSIYSNVLFLPKAAQGQQRTGDSLLRLGVFMGGGDHQISGGSRARFTSNCYNLLETTSDSWPAELSNLDQSPEASL
ncbi:hypothetical protein EVAR_88134_1 [Eumeta japonica]|uniref:Uncharacterized protein n=1 Tax=Eumeta variegata TaxID=151549 RepID=A0A4C1WQW7_EUMVA|nr:hypothetical protein EVAR_88134_1 [Eumeta japonica]